MNNQIIQQLFFMYGNKKTVHKICVILILFLLGLNDLDHRQVIYTILFTQFVLRTVTFSLLPQNDLQVQNPFVLGASR